MSNQGWAAACLLWLAAAGVLGIACADAQRNIPTGTGGTGTLKGLVSFVGVPCGPGSQNTVPPCDGPYPGYQVMVFDTTGASTVAQARSDDGGNYSIELPGGPYVVYRPSGLGQRETLRVSVQSGSTVSLDLRIDTGVR